MENLVFFKKFYLDKEKDIVVNLYKSDKPNDLTYILRTPNHNSGNLITNLAKVANVETEKDENDMKIITGHLPALINDDGEEVYIFRLGGIKIANIYPNGKIERKAKIPAIIKLLMAQTKDYKLPIDKTIIKSYILKESKFKTDLHTHINQILQPDTLIALGIVHQVEYSLYRIKKLGLKITKKQDSFLSDKRKKVEKKYIGSELEGKQLERQINDETTINIADLILNNLENAEENITKIRNSLVLFKDGQAVFTNLEKTIQYIYAIIRGKTVSDSEKIDLNLEKINKIEDPDVKSALLKMIDDKKPGSVYKNNSMYQDMLLWIARDYQKQDIKYVEMASTTLLRGEAGFVNLAETSEIMPEIEKETGVKLRYLAAVSRTLFTTKQTVESAAVIKAVAKSPYVVGMDLVGEEINNVTEFSDIIEEIVKYAVYEDKEFTIRIHAGETDSYKDNVEKALDCMKICVPNGERAPQFRIGHGLYVPDLNSKDGKRIINKMKDLDVVLEFQLTSNVRLNNLINLKDHPIKQYLEAGVKCIQGTDGCGFYGIDTIDEQIALRNLLDINYESFAKMRAVEDEIIARRDKYFEEKSKKFEEFLNGRDIVQALTEEKEKNLSKIDSSEYEDGEAPNSLNAYNIFKKRVKEFPLDKTPIIIAGGSFNSKGRRTTLNENTKKALKELLEKIDNKNTYIIIGHKMQGYERAVLDISKELHKKFNVTAIVPKYISEDVKENLDNNQDLTGVYVSPDPSELGIYKSFNYEIFERTNSVVVAFDGNSPVSNLIQEAKNGKGKAKIYVNSDVDILKEKAKSLEGYVRLFDNTTSLANEILEDNPNLKIK